MKAIDIFLTKAETSDIDVLIDGIARPAAGRGEARGGLTWSKPQLKREVGKASEFFYFLRPQPIEKSRFVEIKVNKKEIKGSKFTAAYCRLSALMTVCLRRTRPLVVEANAKPMRR